MKFLLLLLSILTFGTANWRCSLCQEFVKHVATKNVEKVAISLCEIGWISGKVDPTVCKGLVHEFYPVIRNLTEWKPKELCQRALACPTEEMLEAAKGQEGKIFRHVSPPPPLQASGQVGRFITLNDLHFDENYAIGSSRKCHEPMCCRSLDGAKPPLAREFGEHWCNIPTSALRELFSYASSVAGDNCPVILNGDFPPHDLWMQTYDEIASHVQVGSQAVRDAFPASKVFPNIGNHDICPIGQFKGGTDDQEMYKAYLGAWGDWMSPKMRESFTQGGYYSEQLADGFRLISLQTNYYLSMNLYLYIHPEAMDIGNQLAWLRVELEKAAAAGERVLVVGHIPPGDSGTVSAYTNKMNALLAEFSSIIVGFIAGHTHKDHFEVIKNEKEEPVVNVWIAPSVTMYSDYNPSFRVWYYDLDTFELIDFDQYRMDLEKSNEEKRMVVEKVYSMKSFYGLDSLHPAAMAAFIEEMKADETLFQRYFLNFRTGLPKSCGDICKKEALCGAASASRNLYWKCMGSSLDIVKEIEETFSM